MIVQSNKPWIAIAGIAALLALCTGSAASTWPSEEFRPEPAAIGRCGGSLITVQRTEPKTFNPLTAGDAPWRDVISGMTGDAAVMTLASGDVELNSAISVCLASLHLLVRATSRLGNFRLAVLRSYTLWNAEFLDLRA